MLLGQNVNSYGKGLKKAYDFADLLTEIDQLPGIERIRYLTSHPKNYSDKTIQAVAKSKHVCEHFHLPVQAGGNHVLRWMNRGYSREQYKELLERVREASPNCSITTDIIVGFPQETESCFKHTLELVEWARFDAAFTFVYSPRSGTPAAKMPDTVALEVKKDRLQELMNLQNEISLSINRNTIGQTVELLVEGPSKTNLSRLSGRTRTNKIVVFDGPADLIGKLVKVKITEVKTWNLSGQLVIS
jgi:tRNA-2-methylthio-N6-dimethylallyladenosine synthase